ncbi:MAG: hypothetical protein ACRDYA_20145 [Egibacteraceae bacterium]
MSRIGITGHSNLPSTTDALVDKALRGALTRFASDQPLVGVTCLAEGADQIFARAVLDLGGRLEVILPASDYREEKVKPENLAIFDELLGQATDVRYMPFDQSGSEAYMAASTSLIAACDRLFAVWDGRPSEGFGGTADVVAYARKQGVPVEIVWPEGATR